MKICVGRISVLESLDCREEKHLKNKNIRQVLTQWRPLLNNMAKVCTRLIECDLARVRNISAKISGLRDLARADRMFANTCGLPKSR